MSADLSPVFRESFLHRCGADDSERMRAFGSVLHLCGVGGQRFTGSPTWAREEAAAALRELRQVLEALELVAGNRRGGWRYRRAAAHAAEAVRGAAQSLALALEAEQ